jgi:dolichol kinase
MGLISFALGLVAFIFFFIGPKQYPIKDVPLIWYITGWVAWAAALISVLLGIESLRLERGKSIIWTIAGLILGGLALLILISWLTCARLPDPQAIPIP